MNITITMMSGVVLLALLITATIQIANKTVKKVKRFYIQNKISSLLCEVTCKLATQKKFFTCSPFPGVAKEVLSPNSISLRKGWRYNGANTAFILSNDNIRFITASFTYGKERFLVWKIGDEIYFKSESGVHEHLLPKAAKSAERLLKTARVIGNQALSNHVSEISKRALVEVV